MNMIDCQQIKAFIDSQDHRCEPQIEAHITDCSSCASYKQLADASNILLGGLQQQLSAHSHNEYIYQQAQSQLAKEHKLGFYALLMLCTSVFALAWFLLQGSLTLIGGVVLGGWSLGSAALAWWSKNNSKLLCANAENQSAEFIKQWLTSLSRQLTFIRSITVIVTIEIVVVSATLLLNGFTGEADIILLVVNAILAVGVIYSWSVEIPNLLQERQLLTSDK
jgi:hypothetical protein